MTYKLSISGFTKNFTNVPTAKEIVRSLMNAGVFSLQTGHVKKDKETVAFVAVKSQEICFNSFSDLNKSMYLLDTVSRNGVALTINVKTEN